MFYGIYVADAVQVGFTPRRRLGHGNALTTTRYGTSESDKVAFVLGGCGYGYGACDMIAFRGAKSILPNGHLKLACVLS